MTSAVELPPGSHIDRYRIVRSIGAGAMGVVYEAVHEFTGKPVALKVLTAAHQASSDVVQAMRSEAAVLSRLNHRNLVEVYDAGITGDRVWMAMARLRGESLRTLLAREAPLELGRALRYASEIADAVAVAHEAQVIHRDIKPENVFVTDDDQIRVLDFGTGRFITRDPQPQEALPPGTLPYMSPEHLGGELLDGRADIYALGLVLYESLVGRHPFRGADGAFPPQDQLIGMQLARDPPTLADRIGAGAWAVVRRALAKDRRQRYPSMSAFGNDLRELRLQRSAELSSRSLPRFGGEAKAARGVGPGLLAALAVVGLSLGALAVRILHPGLGAVVPEPLLAESVDGAASVPNAEALPSKTPGTVATNLALPSFEASSTTASTLSAASSRGPTATPVTRPNAKGGEIF